jgi:hypothetical protein
MISRLEFPFVHEDIGVALTTNPLEGAGLAFDGVRQAVSLDFTSFLPRDDPLSQLFIFLFSLLDIFLLKPVGHLPLFRKFHPIRIDAIAANEVAIAQNLRVDVCHVWVMFLLEMLTGSRRLWTVWWDSLRSCQCSALFQKSRLVLAFQCSGLARTDGRSLQIGN